MKFEITRTSSHGDKPCDEAHLEGHVYIDRRSPKSLLEARLPRNRHWSDMFFASGSNFREELGGIARDTEPTDVWVIEIDTLEELLKLTGKYNEIVFSLKCDYKDLYGRIEIYDDYRE